MIQSANKSHLNEILDIEKIVFTKPWTRAQLKNDFVLRTNTEGLYGRSTGCRIYIGVESHG